MPRSGFEQGASPGEWKAWIGFAFLLVATLHFATHAWAFRSGDLSSARRVATDLVMLLVAWSVLSRLMAARWKDRVQQDERDREIEARGTRCGHVALVACVMVLAVLLGVSPVDRLQWATHFVIGNLLVMALLLAWLVESAAVAVAYWWDRR
jgi:hypothetical protein